MMRAPSASRLSARYFSSVAARFSTSHFSSCGIAPCSSATSTGLADGFVHSCPVSSQPPPHRTPASDDRSDACAARVMKQHDDGARGHDIGEGDQVNAADRRECGKWRVAVCVAELQPGKPGEKPAAQPLDQDPARRNQEQRPRRRGIGRDAHDDVAEQCVVRTLDREQCRDQEDREPDGRLAEVVDRRVDPPGAGAEERGAEPEARACGVTGRRKFPEKEERRRPEPGKEVEAVRREREGRRGARDCRDQLAVAQQPRDRPIRHHARASPGRGGTGSGVVTRN